jgi:hypothetical protein
MEIKILDSILHGELKPWKLDTSNSRHFTELVRTAKAVSPTTNAELLKQLTALLADYPTLQKLLAAEASSNGIALQQLLCSIDLPNGKDPVTYFYSAIITAETLRVYNSFMQQSVNWNDSIDIPFQAGRLLNSLKVLTQQTVAELQERGLTTIPDEQSSFIHFALYYLKHSLIQLYFSVQESFKDKLTQVTTLEDFYTLDLVEPFSNHLELKYVADLTGQTSKEKKEKLTFGFNGKKDKLSSVINSLCTQIELLKEDVSPADMLIQLLLSNDIKPGNVQIHLDCDNKNFRYAIEKLTPYFNSLSFINIEHSKSFYSKKGTLLKANNFSKARSFDPKEKATIDNIFKQMQ